MGETLADAAFSWVVVAFACGFVAILAVVLVTSVGAYVDVNAATQAAAQCEGGGLERERATWQLVNGRLGEDASTLPVDDAVAYGGPVLERVANVHTAMLKKTDGIFVTGCTVLVLLAVVSSVGDWSPFTTLASFQDFWSLQTARFNRGVPVASFPGVSNGLHGFVDALNPWTRGARPGEWAHGWKAAVQLLLGMVAYPYRWTTGAFWTASLWMKGRDLCARYGLVTAAVGGALLILYGALRSGATLGSGAPALDRLRGDVAAYNDTVKAVAVQWDGVLQGALGYAYGSTLGLGDLRALLTSPTGGVNLVVAWLQAQQAQKAPSDTTTLTALEKTNIDAKRAQAAVQSWLGAPQNDPNTAQTAGEWASSAPNNAKQWVTTNFETIATPITLQTLLSTLQSQVAASSAVSTWLAHERPLLGDLAQTWSTLLQAAQQANGQHAPLVLDWLTRLQATLQLADGDMGPIMTSLMTFAQTVTAAGGAEHLDMSVATTRAAVADMVGYMLYDAEWTSNVKQHAQNLANALDDLRAFKLVEAGLDRYFKGAVAASVAVLAAVAYVVALRWNDDAMYVLLVAVLGVAGLSALLFVALHQAQTV